MRLRGLAHNATSSSSWGWSREAYEATHDREAAEEMLAVPKFKKQGLGPIDVDGWGLAFVGSGDLFLAGLAFGVTVAGQFQPVAFAGEDVFDNRPTTESSIIVVADGGDSQRRAYGVRATEEVVCMRISSIMMQISALLKISNMRIVISDSKHRMHYGKYYFIRSVRWSICSQSGN